MLYDGIARYTPTLSGDFFVTTIVCDTALLSHISDAIHTLSYENQWLEIGDSIDDVTQSVLLTADSLHNNMLIGCVNLFLADAPPGWLPLDGSTYDVADYPELAAVIPSALISGDTFTLPDMQDAFPSHDDSLANLGALAGSNTLNLTVAQLPAHTHTYIPPALTIEAETPTTPIPTAGIGTETNTGSTGSGDDIDKRPLRVFFIFAIFTGRYA